MLAKDLLQSPYGKTSEGKKYIQCRVSFDDYQYFMEKFAYGLTGRTQIVLSILFKKLIDELREIDREVSLGVGGTSDHVNWLVLADALKRLTFLERCSFGSYSAGGSAPSQHESGGTDGIHPEMQPPTEQRPVKKGRTKTRKRRVKTKEGQEE